MQTAGARALREDDNGMSREAVLLQWERKIEAAERREAEVDLEVEVEEPTPRRRFERAPESSEAPQSAKPALALVHTATQPEPRRFERSSEAAPQAAERRTITITGHPTPARRRRSVVEAHVAEPDRIALWAFLLGLFLVAVAAGTAHA
jgi:hypothetical protein